MVGMVRSAWAATRGPRFALFREGGQRGQTPQAAPRARRPTVGGAPGIARVGAGMGGYGRVWWNNGCRPGRAGNVVTGWGGGSAL